MFLFACVHSGDLIDTTDTIQQFKMTSILATHSDSNNIHTLPTETSAKRCSLINLATSSNCFHVDRTVSPVIVPTIAYIQNGQKEYAIEPVGRAVEPGPARQRSTKGSKFPFKLWNLVNGVDTSGSAAVNWTTTGKSIVISNVEFQKQLKSTSLFKSPNLTSFIRQLNMYGFKKVAALNEADMSIFQHNCFVRGKPELLRLIRRGQKDGKKTPTESSSASATAPSSPSSLLHFTTPGADKLESFRTKLKSSLQSAGKAASYSEGTSSSEDEEVIESEDEVVIAKIEMSVPHFIPSPADLLRNRVFDAVLNDLEREIWENRKRARLASSKN